MTATSELIKFFPALARKPKLLSLRLKLVAGASKEVTGDEGLIFRQQSRQVAQLVGGWPQGFFQSGLFFGLATAIILPSASRPNDHLW
ncbi:MAG: hypothetical protein LBS44_05815 [Deltaproteobacteria bacterium]|jgi:hypothetical protein|nr:hypothetical protein [Deltaproteobacteria bacterium]